MLGKTAYVSSVPKKHIFPLLYIADLGIFRTKLRRLRGSDTLATEYKHHSPCKRREEFSIRFYYSPGRLSP
jgi:hypothetical protein